MSNCNCNSESEYIWKGTGLKYAVSMTGEDFDMDTDDWTITVTRGTSSMEFTRENSIQDDSGQWYICINTDDFTPGPLYITFEARVPDEDFEAGYRREIQKYTLTNVKSL